MKVISRREAKALKLKRYFTGIPCGVGHVAPRMVSNSYCCQCQKENLNQRELSKRLTRERKYARSKEPSRCWHRLHPYRRRIAVQIATPTWADQQRIDEIYAERLRLNSANSQQYEVDHVIPLKGKLVCGLHVHYNLQILTKDKNHEKTNKWVDLNTIID